MNQVKTMIKTKRSAQDAVCDVLSTLKGGMALTSREIYNELMPADLGLFVGGVDGVMKSINKLHTRGLVENGNSEVVNGRMVRTWRLINEVSTDKPVVDAVAETVEAEREYFDGFNYPKDSTNSIESLIEEAQNTALLSVASVFSRLIEQVQVVDFSKREIKYLDDKLKMLNDLSRVFAGSPYAQLLTEIKEDLTA